jgi:hypothetical protein
MPLRIAMLVVAAIITVQAKCKPTFESLHCAPSVAAADEAVAEVPASITNTAVTELRRTNSSPVLEAPPKWMSPYRMAQFAMIGAAASDISSSWGCAEANPILRSADGRFRAQGFAIKAGVTAGGLIATHLLRKKFPKLEKPLTFMMGSTSTFLYATAFRNHSMPCH